MLLPTGAAMTLSPHADAPRGAVIVEVLIDLYDDPCITQGIDEAGTINPRLVVEDGYYLTLKEGVYYFLVRHNSSDILMKEKDLTLQHVE